MTEQTNNRDSQTNDVDQFLADYENTNPNTGLKFDEELTGTDLSDADDHISVTSDLARTDSPEPSTASTLSDDESAYYETMNRELNDRHESERDDVYVDDIPGSERDHPGESNQKSPNNPNEEGQHSEAEDGESLGFGSFGGSDNSSIDDEDLDESANIPNNEEQHSEIEDDESLGFGSFGGSDNSGIEDEDLDESANIPNNEEQHSEMEDGESLGFGSFGSSDHSSFKDEDVFVSDSTDIGNIIDTGDQETPEYQGDEDQEVALGFDSFDDPVGDAMLEEDNDQPSQTQVDQELIGESDTQSIEDSAVESEQHEQQTPINSADIGTPTGEPEYESVDTSVNDSVHQQNQDLSSTYTIKPDDVLEAINKLTELMIQNQQNGATQSGGVVSDPATPNKPSGIIGKIFGSRGVRVSEQHVTSPISQAKGDQKSHVAQEDVAPPITKVENRAEEVVSPSRQPFESANGNLSSSQMKGDQPSPLAQEKVDPSQHIGNESIQEEAPNNTFDVYKAYSISEINANNILNSKYSKIGALEKSLPIALNILYNQDVPNEYKDWITKKISNMAEVNSLPRGERDEAMLGYAGELLATTYAIQKAYYPNQNVSKELLGAAYKALEVSSNRLDMTPESIIDVAFNAAAKELSGIDKDNKALIHLQNIAIARNFEIINRVLSDREDVISDLKIEYPDSEITKEMRSQIALDFANFGKVTFNPSDKESLGNALEKIAEIGRMEGGGDAIVQGMAEFSKRYKESMIGEFVKSSGSTVSEANKNARMALEYFAPKLEIWKDEGKIVPSDIKEASIAFQGMGTDALEKISESLNAKIGQSYEQLVSLVSGLTSKLPSKGENVTANISIGLS